MTSVVSFLLAWLIQVGLVKFSLKNEASFAAPYGVRLLVIGYAIVYLILGYFRKLLYNMFSALYSPVGIYFMLFSLWICRKALGGVSWLIKDSKFYLELLNEFLLISDDNGMDLLLCSFCFLVSNSKAKEVSFIYLSFL